MTAVGQAPPEPNADTSTFHSHGSDGIWNLSALPGLPGCSLRNISGVMCITTHMLCHEQQEHGAELRATSV